MTFLTFFGVLPQPIAKKTPKSIGLCCQAYFLALALGAFLASDLAFAFAARSEVRRLRRSSFFFFGISGLVAQMVKFWMIAQEMPSKPMIL